MRTYGRTYDWGGSYINKNGDFTEPGPDENPDRAGGDIYITSSTFANENLSPHVISEELIHAAQFDSSVSLDEARAFDYSNHSDSQTESRELEAKMLSGIIVNEAGIPFFDEEPTSSAQRMGVAWKRNSSGNFSLWQKEWRKIAKDAGSETVK